MIIVTGGAGFIGSYLVKELEVRGARDIVVCDLLGTDDKWKNIAKRGRADLITRTNCGIPKRQRRRY